MRSACRRTSSALVLLAGVALSSGAQVPTGIYAQQLVEEALARNPGLLVAAMHVTPPKSKENVIIASNIGRLGKAADADDLRVIESGKPHLEVNAAGNRFEAELVLRDVVGDAAGAIGLVFPYRPGDDKVALERRATRIRDEMARRILNVANLMDPFPFEARATTKTHAQKLVDEAQSTNPDLLVLALRAPPRGSKDMVVLGSTFGRHGKKADADDLKVLEGTDVKTGVYSGGKRFGIDLPLHDSSGKTIGTMNVGYAYGEGDDRADLVRKAEKLRGELERRIASAGELDELDP